MDPTFFALPSGFPDRVFNTLKDRAVKKIKNPSSDLDNFLGGFNGVQYRLRACADYSDEFVASLGATPGLTHGLMRRYIQERQLLGFFVSGLAALESFGFFFYFMTACIRPTSFPTQTTQNIRDISLQNTERLLKQEFLHEPITNGFSKLILDVEFNKWKEYRNVLAHRAAPGRIIQMGNTPSIPPDEWKIDPSGVKIDSSLTPSRLNWLVTTLGSLITDANQFAIKYL